MKIALFLDGIEIPPVTGMTYRTINIASELSRIGVDVTLIVCDRGTASPEALQNLPFATILIPEEKFYRRDEDLLQFIREADIELLVATNAASVLGFGAWYAFHAKIPLVAEFHDVEDALLYSLGCSEAEALSYRGYQRLATLLCDRIVSLTDHDRREFILRGSPAQCIEVLPIGVDTNYYSYTEIPIDNRAIGFIGNLFYEPNQRAVERLVSFVLPATNCTLHAIGMVPEEFRRKWTSQQSTFYGRIDDVRPVLKKTSIAVAPLFEGSGMKAKMLIYAALGLPIITTSGGISGLPADCACIVDSIEDYPSAVNSLIEDTVRYDSLRSRARVEVEKNYRWSVVSVRTRKLFDLVLQEAHSSYWLAHERRGFSLRNGDLPNCPKNYPRPVFLREERIRKS